MKMKSILFPKFLFKECKDCPVKKAPKGYIVNPCQNCITQGKAIPPPTPKGEIKY